MLVLTPVVKIQETVSVVENVKVDKLWGLCVIKPTLQYWVDNVNITRNDPIKIVKSQKLFLVQSVPSYCFCCYFACNNLPVDTCPNHSTEFIQSEKPALVKRQSG